MGGEVGGKGGARQRLKPGAQPRSSQSLVRCTVDEIEGVVVATVAV